MNAHRTGIAASLLVVAWPPPLLAQDARSHDAAGAPVSSLRAATCQAVTHALDGPFLARPYLQPGYAPAMGSWS